MINYYFFYCPNQNNAMIYIKKEKVIEVKSVGDLQILCMTRAGALIIDAHNDS